MGVADRDRTPTLVYGNPSDARIGVSARVYGWFPTALDPGDHTIPADRLANPGKVTAMTAPRLRIITTVTVAGQRATLTLSEDLNRADAQRLGAHLEALARTRSRTATRAWPYAGGDGGAAGRGSTRAVVTLRGDGDRAGADRLHIHLAALLSVDIDDLRVDLTALTSADPLLAWALGYARNCLTARGGTFSVDGGRRLVEDNRHIPHAPDPVPRQARDAWTSHRVARGRPETADQP